MDDESWKESAIEWHRELAAMLLESSDTCWDKVAIRDLHRLARWRTREADRLELAREYDPISERRRFEEQAPRLAYIQYRITDRFLRRIHPQLWKPSVAQEKAAISTATAIADWSGMTVIGPLTLVFEKGA